MQSTTTVDDNRGVHLSNQIEETFTTQAEQKKKKEKSKQQIWLRAGLKRKRLARRIVAEMPQMRKMSRKIASECSSPPDTCENGIAEASEDEVGE